MSEKLIINFDATELDNFDLCPFRWNMYHHRHVRPKNKSVFLERGQLIHYCMELYYNKKKEGKGFQQSDIEEIVEKSRIKSVELELEQEEISSTLFQFREYHRYYEHQDNIVPVYVEQPFLVLLYEDDIPFTFQEVEYSGLQLYISGKPDLVFHYNNSSALCVMDHKGVTREFDYSPLRNQFNLYCTAIKTDTFILNKIGFQKSKQPKDRFLRKSFIYSPPILEEWRQETIKLAKEMIGMTEANEFPRRRTSCEKFNGCYLQRYCATKPAAREFLIGTEYTIGEKWDVSSGL